MVRVSPADSAAELVGTPEAEENLAGARDESERDPDPHSLSEVSKKETTVGLPNVEFAPPQPDEEEEEIPPDEDEEDDNKLYMPSWPERIISMIFCNFNINTTKLQEKPVTIFGLFRYAKPIDILLILCGICFAIMAGVCQPLLAMITGRVTNALLVYSPRSSEFKNKANENVYIFLGLGIICSIVNFCQYICFQTVCNRIITKMRRKFIRAILRQNAGWFDKHHAGALTTGLNDNIDRIREGIGEKLGLLMRGIAMLIAAIVISYIYEWRLASVMLGVGPATCIAMSLMSQFVSNTTSKEMVGIGMAGAVAEEALLGVRTVQACNGQMEMVKRYKTQLKKGRNFGVRKGYFTGFFGGLFFFMLFSFLAVGMLYGGYLIKVGVVRSPGDVFVCVMSMLLGAYYLGLVAPHLMVLLNARVAAAVIYSTIRRVPKIDVYSDEGDILENPIGHVEFKDVHFRYPTRRDVKVLNGINLTIEPGQTVALVGHSGCGKSTTVGLLTRLYNPEKGEVLLDDRKVSELNIKHLRNVIGIVQQEPVLFNDTIAENLRLGNPDITEEGMIEVCKMANAHEFIMTFADGYETLVGDGGVQLSGGQKQRLAIARTLARDPRVLLLDEATSALDAESESIVQEALDKAAAGRSTIVIAHRLSTIRNADKIVVFEKGNIIESGTHSELVALGGKYSELVRAQQILPDSPEESVAEFDDVSTASGSDEFGRHAFVRSESLNEHSSSDSQRERAVGEVELAVQEELSYYPQEKERSYSILTIYRNVRGQIFMLLLAYAAGMVRGLDLPGMALAFGYVFRAFANYQTDPHRVFTQSLKALGIFLAIALGDFIFTFLASVFFGYVSEDLTLNLRVRAFKNLLYQDAGYFDTPAHTAGKLITRLAADAPNIRAVYDGRALQIIYGVTSMMVCIIIAFIYAWQIALLGILCIIVLITLQLILAYNVMKANMEIAKADEAGRMAIEIIENVRTIQLLTRELTFAERYSNAEGKHKTLVARKLFFEAANNGLGQSFLFYVCCFCFALGIAVIHKGQKGADYVFLGITAIMLGSVSVMNACTFFPDVVKANSSSQLLFSMINRKSVTGDAMIGEEPEIIGNIDFEHVQFFYPQKPDNPVMTDLTFKADTGKTIALVGPSGAGKSTIICMLERFYEIAAGSLKIDGYDIRDIGLHYLRQNMALVGQEPRLFSGTIKENILLGLNDEDYTQEQIDYALEMASASAFIANLPAGVDTEVGEKGGQLSGGQKQRIAIARAVIRNPKILLLDEATSALDSESERLVQEALDRARAGRTCVTIAHRLSSIQNSDIILYIAQGKVQESGSHRQLMAMRGKYYDLIKKQDLAA